MTDIEMVTVPVVTSFEVCDEVGCTYRQLDYWIRLGLIKPLQPARGSGTARRFTARDVAHVHVLHQLQTLAPGNRHNQRFMAVAREAPPRRWVTLTVDGACRAVDLGQLVDLLDTTPAAICVRVP